MQTESIPTRLIGHQFGRLTIVRFDHEHGRNRRFWACVCACGTERVLREDYIKSGEVGCRTCRRLEIRARQGPKRCPACERVLPRDQFHRDRAVTDGFAVHCKACRKTQATQRISLLRARPSDAVPVPTLKPCCECGETKAADQFRRSKDNVDGLSCACRTCLSARNREWYARAGRAKRLPLGRLARYKMTPADLDAMLTRQEDRCAICDRAFPHRRSYVIDHDHATGAVRGLLCPPCNNGLGIFRDSPEILLRAITYLKVATERH